MRIIAIIALLLLGSAAAAQPKIGSAYTKLDLDHCKRLDRGDEPEWASWRCSGLGGIPLFVQNGDERYDVDAGAEDEDALSTGGFDYPGEKVEWRLLGATPFAIIYRLSSANPERPKTSNLVVETVGRAGKPGCRVASIAGSTPNANEVARKAADALVRIPAKCLKPE